MSILTGCQGKYAVPVPEEQKCPICGERVETFSRAGRRVEDTVCPLCGYIFPAQAQEPFAPGHISANQPPLQS